MKLIDRVSAINWNRLQDEKDAEVFAAHLHEVGRFPFRLPSVMLGVFDLATCDAAASALVIPEVVPYRPNRGVYLVVERADGDRPVPWIADHVERLLALDGVAGLWTFTGNRELRPDRFDETRFDVAVVYLDGDPATVARTQ